MRIGSHDFSLRELAGSMGDFGTLLPFAVGYISVCGMDPSGLLVMMGMANIVTGLLYRLPMPIEPMKVLAIAAIAQGWTPDKIYTSAFIMGFIWIVLGVSGLMAWISKQTPISAVRGVQIALGALLVVEGTRMLSTFWLLGAVSLLIIVIFRGSRYTPAALLLVMAGILVILLRGGLRDVHPPSFSLPVFAIVDFGEIWPVLRDGGIAQIPLTAANAVIATSALISRYWPDRIVTERQLSLNMGVMNLILPFFGGMPLCHGAGGLAAQHYFGARTGGANILEGSLEIMLGIFFARSIVGIFSAFPKAIIGAMMFLVGLELLKLVKSLRVKEDWIPAIVTVAGALVFNMAVGFFLGVAVSRFFPAAENRPQA